MTDNPNVMRGVLTGVVTQLKSKYADHLIDIGGCSLHHVSNAIKNSLPELHNSEELEDFLQNVSSFFTFHVEFCEKFSHIQEIFDLKKHRILQYCEVRFLSVYPVFERLIEQYKALKQLFLEEIPKYHKKVAKQPRARHIRDALKDKFTLPTLFFILHVLEIFQKYEKLFQRSSTTIHLLYDKQVDLFRTTLIYFCRLEMIENCKFSQDLLGFDFEKSENILPFKDFSIGSNAKKLIQDFSENDRTVFMVSIKNFFTKICKQLKKNLSLDNKLLANLRFLNPENKRIEAEKIVKVASAMPPKFRLTTRERDALSIEWKLLGLETIPEVKKVKGHICVRDYWNTIFDLKDAGDTKFPLIQRVVKFALSIAEANADVERIFSQVFHIVNKDRNRLSTDTIRGLLVTKSYLQTIGTCLNFKVDDSMMASIKMSHRKYTERTKSDKNDESCVHKRVLENAKKTFEGNKKLKSIEAKRMLIEKQEEAIKSSQAKAKLHLEQAHMLMEDSEKMSDLLEKEKKELDKSEQQVKQSIIKSTCHKIVEKQHKDMLCTADINNNNENE